MRKEKRDVHNRRTKLTEHQPNLCCVSEINVVLSDSNVWPRKKKNDRTDSQKTDGKRTRKRIIYLWFEIIEQLIDLGSLCALCVKRQTWGEKKITIHFGNTVSGFLDYFRKTKWKWWKPLFSWFPVTLNSGANVWDMMLILNTMNCNDELHS